MNKFKAGDLVYFPTETTKILRLRGVLDDDTLDLEIDIRGGVAFLSYSGKMASLDLNPVIFHATPENHELLYKLYGVEFEAPPKRKTPKEVIQAMLDDGWRAVPCLVNDHEPNLELNNSFIELINRASNAFWVFKQEISWLHAQPIDLKTFKKIIDYVDGKVILEE